VTIFCRVFSNFVALFCKYFQRVEFRENIWTRQWCDKRAAPMDEVNSHPGIPCDADGIPIFFVLPPSIKARYDEKMRRCEARWRATSDPAFVSEALRLTGWHRQPPAPWVVEAACGPIAARRTKKHTTRAYNAAVRLRRYEAVRAARAGGLTWEEAYKCASEVLEQTPARGKWPSMKASYETVTRDLKQGRFAARYGIPKTLRADPTT